MLHVVNCFECNYKISCTIKSVLNFYTLTDQGTEFEFTVVQKLNQGSIPKKGVIFSGLFFCETSRWAKRFREYFFACPDERSGTLGRSKKWQKWISKK